ncbi:efflux RND transporter periplasmic adaptor subunit [Woodsholea maritima]|uniref:efflux RND transporter periplasmic adaptor subunit n=1 Tax=Woodsholea maritima TaxID=240237 RepID=UPI0012EA0011|nr:efflux RND transporter periplasmic adaptor subunit [Woodsholea maritima]
MKRNWMIGLGLVMGLIVLVWIFNPFKSSTPGGLTIETVQVEERDLARLVSSTGPIAPLNTVEVGSQLSGLVLSLHADFNSEVSAGDVLAQIDPQTFQSRVREAEANLEVASSQVTVREANLVSARARLREVQNAFGRAQELVERGTYSRAQFDTAQSAFESAEAEVQVALANLRNARAGLDQRQASLESTQVDLDRTVIRSPIDGVVIDRQVDVGQTVAASFNAPVLFMIAQDLSRIQIEAQIDEADIGQIETGQSVNFQVDAYPERHFEGEVKQVRLAAQSEQNVVTYTVVIEADNPGQRLLPGMTANVSIITGEANGALSLPTAALRFTPRGAAEALVDQSDGNGGASTGPGANIIARYSEALALSEEQQRDAVNALNRAFEEQRSSAPWRRGGNMRAMVRDALDGVLPEDKLIQLSALMAENEGRRGGGRGGARATVWVKTPEGRLRPVRVRTGLSDGQYTQIQGGELTPTDDVVIRVTESPA